MPLVPILTGFTPALDSLVDPETSDSMESALLHDLQEPSHCLRH